MKNLMISLLFIASLFTANSANAQFKTGNPNFAKGQIDVNVGIGLLSTFNRGFKTTIPPINASAEYGITDQIGVGAFLGFSSAKDSYLDNTTVKYSYTIIGVRGSYHVTLIDKLDTYAGLMLGYIIANSKVDSDNPFTHNYAVNTSGIGWSAHIGARYSLNKKMSAFLELGYGIAVLNAGVSMKF